MCHIWILALTVLYVPYSLDGVSGAGEGTGGGGGCPGRDGAHVPEREDSGAIPATSHISPSILIYEDRISKYEILQQNSTQPWYCFINLGGGVADGGVAGPDARIGHEVYES